jgi:branched-chain amino acid aminotransferase
MRHVNRPKHDHNGRLVPRAEATVSVFDSGFVLGDGVWEGFRLVRGTVVFAREHLERLYAGARTIELDIGMSRAKLLDAVKATARRTI